MRDKDLLKLLLQNGWQIVHINGSHHKLRKGSATEIFPIHGQRAFLPYADLCGHQPCKGKPIGQKDADHSRLAE